ncbi:MAG: hypothetical protein ACI4LM_03460 [Anaerovoracaceae bacterium]
MVFIFSGKKSAAGRMLALILAALVFFAGLPVFSQPAHAAGGDWVCYQNSDENNGVTDRSAAADEDHAYLRWSRYMDTQSFTPPLIVGGSLYTASRFNVIKMNKETGEIEKKSETSRYDVGYGLNPITYDKDDGLLFVPVSDGRVQCLDADTLKIRWVSKGITGDQTLCPVTYRRINGKGYVYTGTWAGPGKDGTYMCFTVDDPKSGTEKKPLWTLRPSEAGDDPKGFYWAGAYATDNYVVFGSDTKEGRAIPTAGEDYSSTASVYSVDPRTGKIIDEMKDCRGDIRSCIVHSGGVLYWVTKGGYLYRCGIKEDGTFDHDSLRSLSVSCADAGGKNVNCSMTSTPVVHGGRIYIGVSGTGGQFSADGGHFYAVVDDKKLAAGSGNAVVDRNAAIKTKASLIYTMPVPGYPQAASLVSTASESSSGSVRVYFTLNAHPGSIYYFDDSPSTASNEAKALFRPWGDLSQYCISPLCIDTDGTIYYKNDSGNMMAVEPNAAYLKGIDVKDESGNELKADGDFRSDRKEYTFGKTESKQVSITLDIPDGVTASVEGKAYSSGITVDIPDDRKIDITTSAGPDSRTYRLSFGVSSSVDTLDSIAVNTSNTYGNSTISLDPVFDRSVSSYVTEEVDATAHGWVNIWPEKTDRGSSIEVYPVSGIGNSADDDLNGLGQIEPKQTGSRSYYKLYFAKKTYAIVVRVDVISSSGKARKSYTVTVKKKNNKENYKAGRSQMAVTIPKVGKVKVSRITAGSSYVKLSYKASHAIEYLVRYRKNGKGSWKSEKTHRTSYTISGLAKGTVLDVYITPYGADLKAGKYRTIQRCFAGKTSLKVRGGRRKVSYSLSKTAKASGYEIRFSKNRKLKNSKVVTVRGSGKKKGSIGLGPGTYYFTARPYRKYKGKKYAGAWTSVKKAKVRR